jgi:MOSC domain-containing protein YiiM
MLTPGTPLAQLMAAPMRPGKVIWIGLRPARRAEMVAVEEGRLDLSEGLVGDRYKSATTGNRHLTVIQAEDLAAIASYVGLAEVGPELLRRNVVTRGINLRALKGREFRLGQAVLKMTGDCHPCSRMEETLGVGGYNAVRGHGGITAKVLQGGVFRLGDDIVAI